MAIYSPTLTLTQFPPQISLPVSSSSSTFVSNSIASGRFTRTRSNTGSKYLIVGRPGTRTERVKKGLTCNALFGLGVPELVVIAGVAALVFGPKKLPEVGKSIGKTVKSFQQAAKEFESELKKEPDSATEPSDEKPKEVKNDEMKEVSSSKENV